MQTRVMIIGGGATGAGLARDLSMRGVDCMLADKGRINAGASGANHGLLHSGARYVSNDRESARQCHDENMVLKRIAPHLIEDTGGLFVAVKGDDPDFADKFPGFCGNIGIPCEEIDPREAGRREPALSADVFKAFRVPDASFDPYRMARETILDAEARGAKILAEAEVTTFNAKGGRIRSAVIQSQKTGESLEVEAEIFVNAGGAWSPWVAALAGAKISMLLAKGSLAVFKNRLAGMVINRLRPPGDADILVPHGGVSVLGTTSVEIDDPDHIGPTREEIDHMIVDAKQMIPAIADESVVRSYAGVRPLMDPGQSEDGREADRGFNVIDHSTDGLENFLTVSGGKWTEFRLIAEAAADKVCSKLGVQEPCRTRTEPYPSRTGNQWTEPPFRKDFAE